MLHDFNIDKYRELGALKLVEDFTNSKKKIKVKTICFDDWYHKNINSLEIDLFKTDTQGFDYQVLKGAENTLEKIKVIIAECHFQEFYDNAEPAYEIIKYLYKNNFYIYNILKKNNKIQIHEADIVFVNNNLSLDK